MEELSAALLPERPKTATTFAHSAALLIAGLVLVTCGALARLLLEPRLAVTGLLAYAFGARHGVDADHIAAIDNVTRRMVSDGRRTVTVGLFFSLGHCAVVFVLCGLVITSANTTSAQLNHLAALGAMYGPWVSSAVLLAIGTINLCSVRSLLSQWKDGEMLGHEHEIASLVTRCCPSLLAAIDQPWKVSFIGLLFGLGLDTATEIALLTLTALAQPGVPRLAVLVLPLLFASVIRREFAEICG